MKKFLSAYSYFFQRIWGYAESILAPMKNAGKVSMHIRKMRGKYLKVHKIEIFFGFDFEICIISLIVMSKY
jgi:hypothetical protein